MKQKSNRCDDRLDWWREARFGMFIHWGLYAAPAGVWRGKPVPGIGEWIMGREQIPLAEYAGLAASFDPVDFDARSVARLARAAGMRYLVYTAKHHDGFAMYHSRVSAYNIVDATPCRRDPMRELAAACRREGVRFCLYYSHELDWADPNGRGNDWDFNARKTDFARYLREKVKPQLRELLTDYGPIGLVWFDMGNRITAAQCRDLARHVRSLQPDCIISSRIGHGYGDYGGLGDNQLPAGPLQGDWEVPATLNDTWGFKRHDHHWKSSRTILQLLTLCADRGANYLLNIGPDARGRVPRPSQRILREAGDWMNRHGEAIYGTTPNPFPCTPASVRITQRGRRLYLIFLKWRSGRLRLRGLCSRVRRAYPLGDARQSWPVAQRTTGDGSLPELTIQLPRRKPSAVLPVVVLDCIGEIDVDPRPPQQADGMVRLPAHTARLRVRSRRRGRRKRKPYGALAPARAAETANETASESLRIGHSGLIDNWCSTRDSVEWTTVLDRPGEFEVALVTSAPKYRDWTGGHRVRLTVGNQSLEGTLRADDWIDTAETKHFATAVSRLGRLRIAAAGENIITLRALKINPRAPNGLCVRELVLRP